MDKQTLSFQAEVKQILHLVTHSLYSNKEIFLRELISNASDACDKLRFEAINDAALFEDAPNLEVRVFFDPEAKTLTIRDNGIGMSAEEAVAHLGTIAKSGTREFVARLEGDQKKDASLIGQFGVGFYSGFIVADRITVESRRAGLAPDHGVRWSSSEGAGEFEVEQITRAERGTDVVLHLREGEEGVPPSVEDQVRHHLQVFRPHLAAHPHAQGGVGRGEERIHPARRVGDRQQGLGPVGAREERGHRRRVPGVLQAAQLRQRRAAGLHPQPRRGPHRVHASCSTSPPKAPFDLWNRDKRGGVKLYVKRVFIMDDAEALMPVYLRFVKGVIDSSDLPLNVSRELLQESRDVKAIREGSTKRVLSMLESLADSESAEERDKYQSFWNEFGAVLKEGVGEDHQNRERLAKLYRFASTHAESGVSLADYVKRMKEGQDAIYVITADSLGAAKASPQLEIFRKKGIEVLLLVDRVDEWLLSHLMEFEGRQLQSVAKGAVDLGKLQDESEKKAAEEAAEAFKPVLERLKEALKDRAKDVRATSRLVDSAACIVVEEGEMSAHLARMLKQAGQSAPDSKPILEVNPEHPLVKRLEGDARFDDLAQLLFDQAWLAEGGQLDEPASYVQRVNRLLVG